MRYLWVLLMALSTFTGTFTVSTAAAGNTFDVTNAGMAGIDSSTNAVVFFCWNGRTATGQSEVTHKFGMGYAITATDRGCASSQSEHAAAVANCDCVIRDDACIYTIATAGTIDGAADNIVYITNGFRLTIDDAFPSAYLVTFLAIWGSDLTVAKSVTITDPGATGNQDISTATGFVAGASDQAVVFLASDLAAMNTLTTWSSFQCGAVAGSGLDNVILSGGSQNGPTTMVTGSYGLTGESVAYDFVQTATIIRRATVTAWLTDGFRLNWLEMGGALTYRLRAVCLKGPQFKVFDSTTSGLTTPFAKTGVGFLPVGLIVGSHCQTQSIADTETAGDERSIGFAYGTGTSTVQAQNVVGILDKDNVGTSDIGTAISTSNVYVNQSTATTIVQEGAMALDSFDSDGLTFHMTDADPSGNYFWGLAIGPTAGGAVDRTTTEAVSSSESMARTGVFARTVTEAPTSADVATRIGTFLRTVTAAPTSSDVATQAKTTTRTTTDAPHSADVATRTGVFARTTTDAPHSSESINRLLAAIRSATDAPTSSDVATQLKTTTRTTTEAPTASESLVRIEVLARITTDAPHSTDTAVRVAAEIRTTTDAPHSSDTTTRAGVFLRTATEAPTSSDVVTYIAGKQLTATDASHSSDVATRTGTFSRTTTRAPVVSESVGSPAAHPRACTEALSTADAVTQTKTILRTCVDAPHSSDAAVQTRSVLRTAAEALFGSEVVVRAGVFARTVGESLHSAEVATAVRLSTLGDVGSVFRGTPPDRIIRGGKPGTRVIRGRAPDYVIRGGPL